MTLPTAEPSERRASLRLGWSELFAGAFSGVVLEAAHALKLASYLDEPLTRLLLTLAHAHAVGLALVVLAHAHTGASLDPRESTGRLLRVGATLVPLGFALGALAHPEGDPSLGIVLVPIGAASLLAGLGRLALASWRGTR